MRGRGTNARLRATTGSDNSACRVRRLQNETGEYNCFLNVVVQCLWRCAAFRSGLLRLDPSQLEVWGLYFLQ